MFVTYYPNTVVIATVSNQCYSYLYHHKIHQRRLICCYGTLIYDNIFICIMFYFKPSLNLAFLVSLESVPLLYLWNAIVLLQTNKSITFKSLIIHNLVRPLKDGALSGFGWSWWGRSKLRYKFPVLS